MAADLLPWLMPGRVLDVGVGTGIVAAALRAHGVPVIGVDLSEAMLQRALGRLGALVFQADGRALPIASGSMENVLFVMALHAIGDVAGAVAEAARVLRPGGRVLAIHGQPRRERTDDMALALGPLTQLQDFRSDVATTLAEAVAAADLRPVATAWVATANLAHAPNAVADTIEQRVWSYLWSVDQSTWDTIVVPVVAALRALPEPDRPRTYEVSSRLDIFEPLDHR